MSAIQHIQNEIQTAKSSLAIEYGDGIFLESEDARIFGERLSAHYCDAEPYPHAVIDDFLPQAMAEEILQHFPSSRLADDVHYQNRFLENKKRAVSPYSCDQTARDIFFFFNSGPFVEFLESISNIKGLIPDPYFHGGGFHEIGNGGLLGLHADFRINMKLHLKRRMNVLIYLNKNWKSEYGGALEMWNRDMSRRVCSIEPKFNRCVIFNTDARSYHGHPDPLRTPEGITRKSLALYYYTASEAVYSETPNAGTVFQARPGDDADTKLASRNTSGSAVFVLRQVLPPFLYRTLRALKYRNR